MGDPRWESEKSKATAGNRSGKFGNSSSSFCHMKNEMEMGASFYLYSGELTNSSLNEFKGFISGKTESYSFERMEKLHGSLR